MIKIKQNITSQQLEELTDYQMEKLFDYWWNDEVKPRNKHTPTEYIEYGIGTKYKLPLMSIGDMVEYLYYKNCNIQITHDNYMATELNVNFTNVYYESELCDVLWKAVKEILNI